MTEELRVTMHDEYGRCIHCGFWHKPGTPAEQMCAEHEQRFRASPWGSCGCIFKRLPEPVQGEDGKWWAPDAIESKHILHLADIRKNGT